MAILTNEKQLDKALERYYNRYNKYNEKILKQLGETVKVIGDMKPSEVHQLSQQIKYSEDIDNLIQELADITDMSVQDIEELFDKFAKENVEFSEVYYEAKNKEFKSYEDNVQLKRTVESIKTITNDKMKNISNTNAIGFVYKDDFGNTSFKGLKKTYYDLIDEAVYKVATGTEDYHSAMRKVLNGLADSGIRTHEDKIGYKSGYSRRLDSAIRQNILDGLRSVNIDIQSQIGDEIGADGIEITAHTLCAPDHIPYQGRQYTKEEFEKINDYELDRPIATGEYNCRHFAMQVVLGVDEPMYSKEDLKRFEEESFSKVEYNGKTYTKYEATQVQRQLETAIRKQKDRQIVTKASGDTEGVRIAQQKISQLTNEYKNFSDVMDLNVYKNRLTVSGYKRVSTNIPNYSISEQRAINQYMTSKSLFLNDELRNYRKLTPEYDKWQKNLTSALNKTNNYTGKIVRVLEIDDTEKFLKDFEKGKEYKTNQFMSFSTKEGYNDEANIKIYVNNSTRSKDLTKINKIGENETLYKRNEPFITEKIIHKNGKYYIYLKEK